MEDVRVRAVAKSAVRAIETIPVPTALIRRRVVDAVAVHFRRSPRTRGVHGADSQQLGRDRGHK